MLGGRGEELWPAPGRIFAVGPSHTFMDLATAISTAFARWDQSHLDEFTLSNGNLVAYADPDFDAVSAPYGPLRRVHDIHGTKVMQTVSLGDEFKLVHDLGDEWLHRLTVGTKKIDPLDTLGIRPGKPLPYWGWGTMPDQYGRKWAEDDGESRPPKRKGPDPMLSRDWPTGLPVADPSEVQAAISAADAERLLSAIMGKMIDDVMTELVAGAELLLQDRSDEREAVVFSLYNRLTFRRLPGDTELAETVLAALRGQR